MSEIQNNKRQNSHVTSRQKNPLRNIKIVICNFRYQFWPYTHTQKQCFTSQKSRIIQWKSSERLLGYLQFTWKKRKLPLENSNGSRHSLWEISENMGLDFRRWNISSFLVFLAYLDVLCNWSFSHYLKFYSFIFIHKISTPVVCVNAMHPHVNNFYMSGQRKHIVILGFWVLIRLGFENTSPALQTSAYYRSI